MFSLITFAVGDLVLIKKEIRNKDSDRFEGPFTVIRRIHERSYELKNKQGKTLVRNVEWLRNFKEGGC